MGRGYYHGALRCGPQAASKGTMSVSVSRPGGLPASLLRRDVVSTRKRGFRTDIQALRALAVGLVVLNHYWAQRVPGGYVGVDVFFVISGYLITAHLAKELRASGRIRLAAFYARRVRRLIPAALLVLISSVLLAGAFLPYTRWNATVQEVLGSTFYVENWLLAAKSVNYSAMNDSATVAQHFWSLSVEEQFYLLWPLGLMGLYVAARKASKSPEAVLKAAVGVVAAGGLICSVYVTAVAPSEAYFVTPVRAWEFGVGAAVALAGSIPTLTLRVRNLAALAGFAVILASAASSGRNTPFPGWTVALPVLGTALVILAGSDGARMWHARVTASSPVQFLGTISYSMYLWHWPLIVVAPFVLGAEPGTGAKLGVLFIALVLAWATKRVVEDRWIEPQPSRGRVRVVFLSLTAGMVAVALAAFGLGLLSVEKSNEAKALADRLAANPCHGPSVMNRQADCGNPFTIPVTLPNMGPQNSYAQFPDECPTNDNTLKDGLQGHPASCDLSAGDPKAETVWLVGDSHAQQWQTAVFELAKKRHWKLKWSYFGGCPLVDAPYAGYQGQAADPAKKASCEKWSQTVATAVERDRPSKVFVSMFASGEQIDDGTGRSQPAQYADGVVKYWKRWLDAGATILPIFDPPQNGAVRSPDCVSIHASDPAACAVAKDRALPPDPLRAAVDRIQSPHVRPIDLNAYFCDDSNCYSAIGGVSIYYDPDHLNKEVLSGLASAFADQVG